MTNNYTDGAKAGAAGIVEINTIPRMFYTPTFGSPDMLFYSLLLSSREAYGATTVTTQDKEKSSNEAASRTATYFAGLLLRDENFVPARVLRNYGHHNTLDFDEGTIQVRTELFAVEGGSSSFFTIRLEGRILGHKLVICNAVTTMYWLKSARTKFKKPISSLRNCRCWPTAAS